jgi:hypothetical protein
MTDPIVPNTQPTPVAGTEQKTEQKTSVPFSFKQVFAEGSASGKEPTPPTPITKTNEPEPAIPSVTENKVTPTVQTAAPPEPTPEPKKFLGKFATEDEALKYLDKEEKRIADLAEQNEILRNSFPAFTPVVPTIPNQTVNQVSQPVTPVSGVDPRLQEKVKEIAKWTPDEIAKYNDPDSYHEAVTEHESRVQMQMIALNQEIANQRIEQRNQAERVNVEAEKVFKNFFETHEDYKFLDSQKGRMRMNQLMGESLQGLSQADLALLIGNPSMNIPSNPQRLLKHIADYVVAEVKGLLPQQQPVTVTPTPVAQPNVMIQSGARPAPAPENKKNKQVMGVISQAPY